MSYGARISGQAFRFPDSLLPAANECRCRIQAGNPVRQVAQINCRAEPDFWNSQERSDAQTTRQTDTGSARRLRTQHQRSVPQIAAQGISCRRRIRAQRQLPERGRNGGAGDCTRQAAEREAIPQHADNAMVRRRGRERGQLWESGQPDIRQRHPVRLGRGHAHVRALIQ
jgi:hypothetical protein